SARSTTGTIAVRCARDAISGTTPPKMRWTSCERITSDLSETSSPAPSSTAADVSSHDVSIPRTLMDAVSAVHGNELHLHLPRPHAKARREPSGIDVDEMRQRIGEGNHRANGAY